MFKNVFILRGALVPAVALFAFGCAKPAPPGNPPAAQVVTTKPLKMDIVEWDEYVGRIDAIEEVEVRARVSGHLQSTHFIEGQMVEKGDLLSVLDQRPFQMAVDQAVADLAGMEAKSREAKAELTRTQADIRAVEAKHELAKQMLDRSKRLLEKATVSQEEFDIRNSSFNEISAELDVRRAQLELARVAIQTADANVNAASARLRNARLNLEYTEVRAPVTGRVSNRTVTDGNLISGGTDQATILTTIVSLNPIHCYFDTDEQSFLKYMRLSQASKLSDLRATKLPVLISLADEKREYPRRGHLDFLDNRVNRTTATMRTRAILSNTDFFLTPGLFAKVRVPGSERYEAILIPDSAIGTDQSEKFVMAINSDHVVERRRVNVGPRMHGLRIVREGLSGEEQIITRGLQRVRPGDPVDASFEETVAVDDGLPNQADPIPENEWLPSYSGQAQRISDATSTQLKASIAAETLE